MGQAQHGVYDAVDDTDPELLHRYSGTQAGDARHHPLTGVGVEPLPPDSEAGSNDGTDPSGDDDSGEGDNDSGEGEGDSDEGDDEDDFDEGDGLDPNADVRSDELVRNWTGRLMAEYCRGICNNPGTQCPP